jgi:16S rRNA (uracil1498-N3)-methyltransferase
MNQEDIMQNIITQSGQKHLFSLFYAHILPAIQTSGRITDKELCLRITSILRLAVNDQLILFSTTEYALITIDAIDPKKQAWVSFTCINKELIKPITPHITLYIGLNKKNNWPEILYAAAQMGVTIIQPIITQRAQTELLPLERMNQIMISACEQAKQFQIPEIKKVCKIDGISLCDKNSFRFFADPAGAALIKAPFLRQSFEMYKIAVGPEAGFTQNDEDVLKQKGFLPYALTPTILRTIDAVPLTIGIIRSFCKQ